MLVLVFISTNALSQNFIQGQLITFSPNHVSVDVYRVSCGSDVLVDTYTTKFSGDYYGFGGLANGLYRVVPDNTSYLFSPEFQNIQIPQTQIHSYDFWLEAILISYGISGTVCGDVQEGVKITLSGEGSTATTTESNGNYSFTYVDGSYTITPSKSGYMFDPVRTDVTIVDADVTGVDFTATKLTCDDVDRFLDNGDGTVTDCRTDLVWLKNTFCFDSEVWGLPMTFAAGLNDSECGLNDGSVEGDWRQPTKEELQGIGTDPPTTWAVGSPPVTWTKPDEPFEFENNFWQRQNLFYWTSTEYDTDNAWVVLSTRPVE